MSKIVKELLTVAKELIGCSHYALKRVAFKYQDVGHGTGALLWWVGRDGKVKTFKSTGRETHHDLDKKLDMDTVWRGRLEPSSGRVTILPPLSVYANPRYSPEDIPVPDSLLRRLEKLGATVVYVDTQHGMGRISKKLSKRVGGFAAREFDTEHGTVKVNSQGYVSGLFVSRDSRQAGEGTKLMKQLTEYADQHGQKLSTSIGSGRRDLIPFYAKFGFNEVGTDLIGISLEREPR